MSVVKLYVKSCCMSCSTYMCTHTCIQYIRDLGTFEWTFSEYMYSVTESNHSAPITLVQCTHIHHTYIHVQNYTQYVCMCTVLVCVHTQCLTVLLVLPGTCTPGTHTCMYVCAPVNTVSRVLSLHTCRCTCSTCTSRVQSIYLVHVCVVHT